MAIDFNDQGDISFDPEEGTHVCTRHGYSVRVADEQPTESGSWLYRCTVCGVAGWSGL